MKTSRLVLGTVQFGLDYGIRNNKGRPSLGEVFEILDLAYENGVRRLDTAEAYGQSLDVIAEDIKRKGDRFEIQSKFKLSDLRGALTDHVRQQCLRLGRQHLDTYSFHRFEDFVSIQDPRPFQELQAQGLVRVWGLSVYRPEEAQRALESGWIKLLQIPLNLFDHEARWKDTLRAAKRVGCQVEARSVFLQGLFHAQQAEFDQAPAPFSEMRPALKKLRDYAALHALELAEMALLYPFEIPDLDKVLIGVDSRAQLEQNLSTLRRNPVAPWREELPLGEIPPESWINPSLWPSWKLGART